MSCFDKLSTSGNERAIGLVRAVHPEPVEGRRGLFITLSVYPWRSWGVNVAMGTMMGQRPLPAIALFAMLLPDCRVASHVDR